MNVKIEVTYTLNNTSVIYEVSSNEIISCEWSNNVLDADLSITPGICEQYAEIKFYNNFLVSLLQDYPSALYAPESSTTGNVTGYVEYGDNATQKVFSLFISSLDVDTDNNIITIYAKDPSYIFKNDNFIIEASPVGNYTLTSLFEYLQSKVPYSFQYANMYVKDFMNKLHFDNGFIVQGNLYDVLMRICDAALLRVYWSKENVFLIDEVLI